LRGLVDEADLRDPKAEQAMRKFAVLAIALLVAAALGAAAVAALLASPPDHHYRYAMTFENPSNASFVVLVPLPLDPEWQAKWTIFGNESASVEQTQFGTMLRVAGFSRVDAVARLDTRRDVPLVLTTEGPDLNAKREARAMLNATGPAPGAHLRLTIGEFAPAWNTTRFVEGDLFEGWNTIAVREELDHA
jgi:hypothetical protein